MQGTLVKKIKRQGSGHGKENHRHASGNGLVRYYYGSYRKSDKINRGADPHMFEVKKK